MVYHIISIIITIISYVRVQHLYIQVYCAKALVTGIYESSVITIDSLVHAYSIVIFFIRDVPVEHIPQCSLLPLIAFPTKLSPNLKGPHCKTVFY